MKKILVPTDFSDCANSASETALKLAEKAGAEIHFFHALHTPVDWVRLSLKGEDRFPEVKERIGKANYMLEKWVERAEKSGVKARKFLAFDSGHEEIEKHISNFHHDFVVMGSNGRKGIANLIGSNAQKVLRYSKAPVLVIKRRRRKKHIKSIVFASTFDKNHLIEFKKTVHLAKLYEATIHLLFVNTPYNFQESDDTNERMEFFQKSSGYEKCRKHIYNSLSEEKGILNFSIKMNADITSLVTHGRPGILRIISPSVTEFVANHSDMPVLSVRLS